MTPKLCLANQYDSYLAAQVEEQAHTSPIFEPDLIYEFLF